MIYSIGHSTLSIEDFVALSGRQYDTLLDVRSHPTSRWSQFYKENLEQWMPQHGYNYEWWPELGGWRTDHECLKDVLAEHGVDLIPYLSGKFPKQRIAAEETPSNRPSWTNTGLRDYSFFQALPEFLSGCDRLIERGKQENVAIMCCECQWWRCHRSMVSDYLAYRGVEVFHIMPRVRQKNKVKYVDGSKITPHSAVLGNRIERYEEVIRRVWDKWTTMHGPT